MVLLATAKQARGKPGDAAETLMAPSPEPAVSPGARVGTDEALPSLPPVPQGTPKLPSRAPPRSRSELRKELARLDAIEDRVSRSQIDIALERIELGHAPLTSVPPRRREWVDEGPALTFTAPRHRAEPEHGSEVDPTAAELAELCDTVPERRDPPVKWMVEAPKGGRTARATVSPGCSLQILETTSFTKAGTRRKPSLARCRISNRVIRTIPKANGSPLSSMSSTPLGTLPASYTAREVDPAMRSSA